MAKQKSESREPAVRHPAGGWPFRVFSDDFDRLMSMRLPRLFSDLEEGSSVSNWKPAVDVKETDKEYLVSADIPGVDPKDIDVRMEKGMLTIKGERKSETRDENNGYRRVERFEGSFFRRLMLPDAGDAEKIEAKSRNGVLEIRIPKAAGGEARRIPVK